MTIEFVDLKRQYRTIRGEIGRAVKSVLEKQSFILGEELAKFEWEFARYLGSRYVVGVDNGTDGLILALMSLGIAEGDEVITPVNSFIATTLAITEVGATPAFVDVDPATHQLDVAQVQRKITQKTKVVLPVHLYGAPCAIEELSALCRERDILLVEDACQAHGAKMKGKKLGTFGTLGVFSFYPSKNLGAYGNGGAICTNSKSLYEKLLRLRNFGQRRKYDHEEIGLNSKLDDLQAAVLRVKLKHLDRWNKQRHHWAKLYQQRLRDFKFPVIIQGGEPNRHLLVIEVEERDKLLSYLASRGIKAQVHYPIPIHLQKCYACLGYRRGAFPVAEKIAKKIISLPMYAELTEKEVNFVSNTINDFYG
jgi:dTDP-4-amino-4,6-dideoxygalactose transaminase